MQSALYEGHVSNLPENDQDDQDDSDSLHSLFSGSETDLDYGTLGLMEPGAKSGNATLCWEETLDWLSPDRSQGEAQVDEQEQIRSCELDSTVVQPVTGSAGDAFDFPISCDVPSAPDSRPTFCLSSSGVDPCSPEQSRSSVIEADFATLAGVEDIHCASSNDYLTWDGAGHLGLEEDHTIQGKLQIISMHFFPCALDTSCRMALNHTNQVR